MVDVNSDTARDIINALNGTELFDIVTAAMGYIDEDQYLRVPQALRDTIGAPLRWENVVDFTTNLCSSEEVLDIAALNVPCFTESAELCAYIRAILIQRGMLTVFNERNMKINEVMYCYVSAQINMADVIADPVAHAKNIRYLDTDYATNRRKVTAWVIQNRSKIAALHQLIGTLPTMVAHIFVQLGHHFIDVKEYNELAERLLIACVMNDPNAFMKPRNMLLFRTTVHPFGLTQFLRYFDRAATFGKIPPAMIVRRNAAPAGAALVTSTYAILVQMNGHKWFNNFTEKYGDSIMRIRAVTDHIVTATNRLRYHESARFMGAPDLSPDELAAFGQAKMDAVTLAPYLQAYLEIYAKKSDLGRIKAINKYAMARIAQYTIIKAAFKEDKKSLEVNLTVRKALDLPDLI